MSNPIAALLQPIKDRLNAATPGPWHLDREEPGDVASVVAYAHNDGVTIGTYVADTVEQDGDAELIVNAPTDQARLIAAVEAVEALAEYWESTPALRNGPAAKDLRAALVSALESAA